MMNGSPGIRNLCWSESQYHPPLQCVVSFVKEKWHDADVIVRFGNTRGRVRRRLF